METCLAEQAAMSRTTFALRYRKLVGLLPRNYLTRWRMTLASKQAGLSGDSAAEAGIVLGYETGKSFSAAFKRVMNRSQRQYGHRQSTGIDEMQKRKFRTG